MRSPSWCITFLHLPSLRIICDRCGENRIGKHDGETIARSRCPLPEYLPSDTWERQRAPAERHRPPRATGATTCPGSFSWGSRLVFKDPLTPYDCSRGENEVERTTIAFNGSVYGVGSTENAFGAQIAGDGDMGDVWRASGSRLGLALGMRTAMMWGCRLGSRGGRARREKELWRRNHRRYARRVLRGRTGRLERRRRRWEFRRGARTSSEGAPRFFLLAKREERRRDRR